MKFVAQKNAASCLTPTIRVCVLILGQIVRERVFGVEFDGGALLSLGFEGSLKYQKISLALYANGTLVACLYPSSATHPLRLESLAYSGIHDVP